MQKKGIYILFLLNIIGFSSNLLAQQISTLYFLENAPMRHELNPAFQPISDGFVNITPLGHSTLVVGNNSFTMNDVIEIDGESESIMQSDPTALLKQIKQNTIFDVEASLGLFNFGFRHREKGYFYFGANERIECGIGLTKDFFDFALDGGIEEFKETKKLQLDKCGVQLGVYTEFYGGYAYKINEKWTVGGKLKFMIGQTNLALRYQDLSIDFTPKTHHLYGIGNLQCAVPFNLKAMNGPMTYQRIASSEISDYFENVTWKDYLTPRGYGAGLDVGFTYKPHPQVQISAAINNLGFIVWNGTDYKILVDSAFSGQSGKVIYEEVEEQYNKSTTACELVNNIANSLNDLVKNMYATNVTYSYTRMLSGTINVGVDANFFRNILGIGVISSTQYYDRYWYEEVTLGGAVRPCNWFNFALSYSLVNNGKYSNFGAGISIMAYDGVNFTLAADYIPTSYMKYNGVTIPDKCKGINLTLGCNIVWGTNKHKTKIKKGG